MKMEKSQSREVTVGDEMRGKIEQELTEVSQELQTELSETNDFGNSPDDAAQGVESRIEHSEVALRLRQHQQALRRALEKIDLGTYGVCERCGESIEKARLEAMPTALFCVSCQGR